MTLLGFNVYAGKWRVKKLIPQNHLEVLTFQAHIRGGQRWTSGNEVKGGGAHTLRPHTLEVIWHLVLVYSLLDELSPSPLPEKSRVLASQGAPP